MESDKEPTPQEIQAVYSKANSSPEELSSVRALKISEQFLGKPYKGGPCGEGSSGNFEPKPQACLTSFDCTTYVEAVLALAISRDQGPNCSDSFWKIFREIKYCDSKEISYKNRNHFVEIHWCANQNKKGFLKDLTLSLFPEAPEQTKWINTDSWIGDKITALKEDPNIPDEEKTKKLEELQKASPNFSNESQKGALRYIPLSELTKSEIIEKIKAEKILVFNLVKDKHTKNPKIPVMVSHQGFIVEKQGVLYIRHASPAKDAMSVVDVPFETYISERMKDTTWPTLGFNLQKIQ